MRGFTTIEAMITIVVLAILAGIAVPSYRAFVQNAQATALANDLSSAVWLARSTAMQRSVRARLEPRTADGWAGGWQVVVVDGGDVIRVWDAVPATSIIQQQNPAAALVFGPLGDRLSSDASGQFTVGASGCTGDRARELRVRGSGHVEIAPAACGSL